jgi:hypothetical protein
MTAVGYTCMARWYATHGVPRIDKDGDRVWSRASDLEIETSAECSRMDRELRSRMQPRAKEMKQSTHEKVTNFSRGGQGRDPPTYAGGGIGRYRVCERYSASYVGVRPYLCVHIRVRKRISLDVFFRTFVPRRWRAHVRAKKAKSFHDSILIANRALDTYS